MSENQTQQSGEFNQEPKNEQSDTHDITQSMLTQHHTEQHNDQADSMNNDSPQKDHLSASTRGILQLIAPGPSDCTYKAYGAYDWEKTGVDSQTNTPDLQSQIDEQQEQYLSGHDHNESKVLPSTVMSKLNPEKHQPCGGYYAHPPTRFIDGQESMNKRSNNYATVAVVFSSIVALGVYLITRKR